MKTVSLQELKLRLSALVSEAGSGVRILITRHRRPLAVLSPAEPQHVHVGRRFGRGELGPLLDNATQGRYLEVLAEDRSDAG